MKTSNKIAVIGSGFSGLTAASILASKGCEVTLFEKNTTLGGRARELQLGDYRFEMGPSWYWMPEVFEEFFARFGKTTADFYELKRLDPSYKVIKSKGESYDIPASIEQLTVLFEHFEPGSGAKLQEFLHDAEIKYNLGMGKFARKPALSITEFLEVDVFRNLLKLDLFRPITAEINKAFKHPVIREILQFPVLFLGARPEKTPALYSMMNHADLKLGTWYPLGGMISVVNAFVKIARSQQVTLLTDQNVEKIVVENRKARGIIVNQKYLNFDAVLSTADYRFTDMQLLDKEWQSYSPSYWEKRQMSPSALMFYIGLNAKIPELLHHNLFFDKDFKQHAEDIYTKPQWPKEPLFYVSSASKSDDGAAPDGCDNMVILIPLASGLKDDKTMRNKYFNMVCNRILDFTDFDVRSHLVESRSYCIEDFKNDYNAFKGNAYGLANTLRQTAIFRPSIRSRKVSNLFYAGQLTVPGPGVPPAIISGEMAAAELLKEMTL